MENREICHFTASFSELCHAVANEQRSKFPLQTSVVGHTIPSTAVATIPHLEWLRVPTFSEYLRDGYEISLIGAIDFTYSNGLQTNPSSLHHVGGEN